MKRHASYINGRIGTMHQKSFARRAGQKRREEMIQDQKFLVYVARVVLAAKLAREAPPSELERQKETLRLWERQLESMQRGFDHRLHVEEVER